MVEIDRKLDRIEPQLIFAIRVTKKPEFPTNLFPRLLLSSSIVVVLPKMPCYSDLVKKRSIVLQDVAHGDKEIGIDIRM